MTRSSRFARFGALALVLGAATTFASQPAHANLVLDTSIDLTGSGLGAVPTIVTAGANGPPNVGPESGCVGRSGGGDDTSSSACLFGLTGGDNGEGINRTHALSDITQDDGVTPLTQLGDIALVFNLAEIGRDLTVGLANLYVSIFDGDTLIFSAELDPADQGVILNKTSGTGIGGSGFVFRLDDEMYAAANLLGFDETWRVGGGFEAVEDTASNGPETVNVVALPGDRPDPPNPPDIPEPGSLSLMTVGLLGLLAANRRRRKAA